MGWTYDEIADEMGMASATLRRHCMDELKHGKQRANARVAGALFQAALKGCKIRQMFWLKCQAGWRDRQTVELTGKDGAPLTFTLTLDTHDRDE